MPRSSGHSRYQHHRETAWLIIQDFSDRLVVPGVAVLGALLTWWITRHGMVTSPDSATYLSAAQHLSEGFGPTASVVNESSRLSVADQLRQLDRIPLNEWPPGYSFLLFGASPLGGIPLDWARSVAMVSAAALCAAAASLARLVGASRVVFPALLAMLVLFAPSDHGIDVGRFWFGSIAFALTEAPFSALVLLALLAATMSLATLGPKWVIATVVLVAAAPLVRFSGLAVGPALGVGVMLVPVSSLAGRPRLRASIAVAFGTVGVAATAAWTLLNSLSWGGGTPRAIGWHPSSTILPELVRTSAMWFGVSDGSPMWMCAGVVFLFVVAPVIVALHPGLRRRLWAKRGERTSPFDTALILTSLMLLALLSLLVLTRLVFDSSMVVGQRQMSCLQPLSYLLAMAVVIGVVNLVAVRVPAVRHVAFAGVVALVGVGGYVVVNTLPQLRATAAEYSARQALERQVSPYRRLPENVVLFSNQPSYIWLESDRTSLLAPPPVFFTTGNANPDYEANLELIGRTARRRAVIVSLGPSTVRDGHVETAAYLREHEGFRAAALCHSGAELWTLPGGRAAALAQRIC